MTTSSPAGDGAPTPPPAIGVVRISLCVLFGVLLPLVTLGLEFLTHLCAEFFDPIPTPLHYAAIASVAVANLVSLCVLAGIPAVSGLTLQRVARFNATTAGIAAFYSLWFGFLTPFAVIGILFFGAGFLPLSPLLSLLTAWFLRVRLRRKAERAGLSLAHFWAWFGLGFGGLVMLEIPGLVRAWATSEAIHGDAAGQAGALMTLRRMGSEDSLLRSCYRNEDEERSTVYGWLFGRTDFTERQTAYYRLTGQPFNHRPPPARRPFFGGDSRERDSDDWVWDDSLGEASVGRRLKALYLAQSRIDGTVEGDAALGYLEWTMVFRNDHEVMQQEARALIQLPAGAVVSRLTLWIDGEEREAAFGGRSQVRQAYQAVVQRRRDPVLVTMKGPDRVLLQCFPVLPKHGEMKLRVGITVPLASDGLAAAHLALPRLIEQNFSMAKGLSHTVWIESAQALSSRLEAYRMETPRPGQHALHGQLSSAQFESPVASLAVARDPGRSTTWTRSPLDPQNIVVQSLVQRPAAQGPVAVVIDGSHDLAAVADSLADVLEALPPSFPLQLRVAGDEVLLCPSTDPRVAAAWLRTREFAGGQDATVALQEAVDSLGAGDGTVWWIHGAQPVTWQDTAALEQSLARRKGHLRLLAFPAAFGPNLILEKLADSPGLTPLARVGETKADLGRVMDRLQKGEVVTTRTMQPASGAADAAGETSAHLARLWAVDEVARLLAGGQVNREAAVRLAVRMQLVTALSGAVVLETKQQYDAAGLEPVDPKTAPHVPEGGSTLVALLGAMALMIFFTQRGKRRSLEMNAATAGADS